MFDTTSADAGKIAKYRKMLDALGYESKMVHVMASLENAQKTSRPRKLPQELLQETMQEQSRTCKTLRKFSVKI